MSAKITPPPLPIPTSAASRVPTSDPRMPRTIVRQMDIGSGPGTASRATSPTINPPTRTSRTKTRMSTCRPYPLRSVGMRVGRAALLCLLLCAVAVTATGAGSAIVIGNDAPAWSPDGRQIAFTSFRHGNGEIYVMRSDGSAKRRLTNNTAHDDHAKWSPDGTRIAFASTRDGNYEIYVMNADGSSPRRLTNDPQSDYAPTWSPDGQRIAWRTNRDGNGEIYSMRTDGTDQQRLTANPSADESPDWSSDGRIAFSSNRGGAGTFQIWAMDADGSNVVRLSAGGQKKSEPPWTRAPT